MCRTNATISSRPRSAATAPSPRVRQAALLGALLVAASLSEGGRAAPTLPTTPPGSQSGLPGQPGQRHLGASPGYPGHQMVLRLQGSGGKARGLG